MKVEILERRRADYYADERKLYDALYRGGHTIEQFKAQLLPKRPAETDAWYALRLSGFSYLNRAAQVLGELAASVFAGDLQIAPAKDGETRPPVPDDVATFIENPLGRKEPEPITDVLFLALSRVLVEREHFFLVGFPDAPGAQSRGDQEAMGALRPFLRHVPAGAVIDLGEDDEGLTYVMLRHRIIDDAPLKPREERRDRVRWTLIERTTVRTWEIEVEPGKEPEGKDDAVEGPAITHRWAGAQSVPVVRFRVGENVWLMDRIASLLKAETRKRNGLDWYEELACYPLPVHKGDETLSEKREADPGRNASRAATTFFEIEKEGELAYLEPSGGSLEHLAKRIEAIGIEIATVTHHMASSLGPTAAAQMQSAASKIRDSVAKRLLADCYADDVRQCAERIMRLVSIGRGEDTEWEALGLDQHDPADAEAVTAEAEAVQGIKVPSPTFRKEYVKRFARSLLPGAPVETLETIDAEIDAAEADAFEPMPAVLDPYAQPDDDAPPPKPGEKKPPEAGE